jgi:hypothetical protein|tara:strand:- start:13105 stop:13893 length:789 start_codon:yes stop_codon:yes gene_type:complete
MALKPFVGSEEGIPEALREHYSLDEDTGSYRLNVEQVDGWALENVSGLKSTLGKLKERSQAAEAALQPYAAIERDAGEITSALQELNQLREAQGDESEQVNALKQGMENLRQQSRNEIEKAVAPLQAKLEARTGQLKEATITSELRKAIVDQGGNPTLLVPAMLPSVRAEESDDGRIHPVVVDSEGTARVTGADLAPMSFQDLVSEVKDRPEYAPAFSANGASGGGTNSTVQNNHRGTLTAEQAGQLSMPDYRRAKEEGRIQ